MPAVASLDRWPEGGPERASFVGLDRNERVGPLPAWFLEELRARLTSALASSYPAPHELHDELAAALELPRERLLVTSGTDAALRQVHLAYVREGDAVVRLEPTYAMVAVYARMFGAREVAIGYDASLRLDIDALLQAVDDGPRLVVAANPNQPTGTLLPPGTVEELLVRCERSGALLVLDEAYQAFSGVTALPLVSESENLLVLRTFSKAAGLAGLRIGFAAASPAVIRALYAVRSAGETNALAVEAARLVVARPELVADYAAEVAAGRAALDSRARALGLEPLPGHANFTLLRLPTGRDPAALAQALRERGYIVKGPYPVPCLDECIRVTLGPPELMERFAAALADALRASA